MVAVSTTSTIDPVNMYNNVNNFFLNPRVLFIIILVILIFIALSSSFLGGKDDDSENKTKGVGIIVVVILVILIIINAFQYFLNVNITAYFNNFFNPNAHKKQIDIVIENTQTSPIVPEIKFKKQVYNIPGNYYTYSDAKAVCQAYGSELASYEQIEDAYTSGGEWCNYGWSDNQLALYPTQQETYDELQSITGHEHDCGRPGVNGGFIANPNVRFGVNCYGNKPRITQEEEDLMQTSSAYPKTNKDLLFQQKVDYWKQHISKLLVSPFNHGTWGQL
jgi:hypothetical protein